MDLHPEAMAGPASSTPGLKRPSSRQLRAAAILAGLCLAAIALTVLPRKTYFYPTISVTAEKDIQGRFVLKGQADFSDCEKTVASLLAVVHQTCPECRINHHECQKGLTAETELMFSESRLVLPSAKFENGVATYDAPREEDAFSVCRVAEGKAIFYGSPRTFSCFPANVKRPASASEVDGPRMDQHTFNLLIASVDATVAWLVAVVCLGWLLKWRADRRSGTLGKSASLRTVAFPAVASFTLAGVDVLVLLGTFLAMAWVDPAIDQRWSPIGQGVVLGHGIVIAITVGWFWVILDQYARRRPFWEELREVLGVLVIICLISNAAAFVVDFEGNRVFQAGVWALNFLLLPLARAGARNLLDDLDLWLRPAVVIGTGDNAVEAYLAIQSEKCMGYRVLGFVDRRAGEPGRDGQRADQVVVGDRTFPVFHPRETIEGLVRELGSPQVILALDSLTSPDSQRVVKELSIAVRNMHIIPALRGLPLFGTEISHLFQHEVVLLTVRNNLTRPVHQVIKRLLDCLAAAVLLLLLSPVFLVLSLKIRGDGGQAIYGHWRVGRFGRSFRCWKFRTMCVDADRVLASMLREDPGARAEWERDFKLKVDPRVTPVGRFLRKTSLDELPQLFNVLCGEMSLVGPRPVVRDELDRYGESTPLYLNVRPGITGLWQISGRNDASYWRRVSLDVWYVQNWSLWYDAAILFKTLGVVFGGRGAY